MDVMQSRTHRGVVESGVWLIGVRVLVVIRGWLSNSRQYWDVECWAML